MNNSFSHCGDCCCDDDDDDGLVVVKVVMDDLSAVVAVEGINLKAAPVPSRSLLSLALTRGDSALPAGVAPLRPLLSLPSLSVGTIELELTAEVVESGSASGDIVEERN